MFVTSLQRDICDAFLIGVRVFITCVCVCVCVSSPGHEGYRGDGQPMLDSSSPGGRGERPPPSSMQGMDMASLPPRKRPWHDGPGTGDPRDPREPPGGGGGAGAGGPEGKRNMGCSLGSNKSEGSD